MAEYVEVVVKIPKYYLTHPQDYSCLAECVRRGVVLPKGHGDLIDKSKIHKAIYAEEDNCTGMGMPYGEMNAYNDGIDVMYSLIEDAKPIIEADKAESEE